MSPHFLKVNDILCNVCLLLRKEEGGCAGMIGFILWCMIGCLFVFMGIAACYSKKPVGFWNVCRVVQVTDVKKYNRAVGKLWCVAGVCFIGLGMPLLAGQNSPIILVSLAGSLVWAIGVMVIYELGIMRKYRKQ